MRDLATIHRTNAPRNQRRLTRRDGMSDRRRTLPSERPGTQRTGALAFSQDHRTPGRGGPTWGGEPVVTSQVPGGRHLFRCALFDIELGGFADRLHEFDETRVRTAASDRADLVCIDAVRDGGRGWVIPPVGCRSRAGSCRLDVERGTCASRVWRCGPTARRSEGGAREDRRARRRGGRPRG